ncbi:hypothetical protein JB92DRAFT_3278382 [Gautieria morchelliformis]|nr:hypothetical protein JB92DRAFT_3278382 [Gautieria morchelliformis]
MESTELSLPPELPYPITICSLDLHPPAEVSRGTRMLTYAFTYHAAFAGDEDEEGGAGRGGGGRGGGGARVGTGTWDSPVEGRLEAWRVKVGEEVGRARGREPVVSVLEPCKHGMQVGGLCGLCGKDMTSSDYTGFSNAARASIQMTHSARGPTVSLEEAQRFERESAARLLRAQRLSLIVDLDQTIVHATVDPTVGEWIAEGEAWDAAQGRATPASDGEGGEGGEKEGAGEKEGQEDVAAVPREVNPNWEALRDVRRFRLGSEGVAPRTSVHAHAGAGAGARLDAQGCMYYIKPRPGLPEFLRRMSAKYEMHVYTMGTRAYAEAVCAAIDPGGGVFRGRILSRDESGSLTQKSLQRLFPCDTSMVVIIDDRADVWEWSPNLLKVRPYDFFVGIGDINSTFLPKAPSLVPVPAPGPSPAALPARAGMGYRRASTNGLRADGEAADAAFASQNRLTIERIAAQVEERPLAREQEKLLADGGHGHGHGNADADAHARRGAGAGAEREGERDERERGEEKPGPRKALLKNDDTELVRVASLLDEVHTRFFDAYAARIAEPEHEHEYEPGADRAGAVAYDVKTIIPRIRAETLAGTHLLFSSVIPLDVDPPSSEIWRTAEVFGATCHTALSRDVTHVVAAKRGTIKVDAARRQGGIYVVWLGWFLESLAHWRRQDEAAYLIDGDGEGAGPGLGAGTPKEAGRAGEGVGVGMGVGVEGDGELLTADEEMWADANAEVDAALEESDDEDGDGGAGDEDGDSGWRTDGSVASSSSSRSAARRKRTRSSSGSEAEARGDEGSPLAKRKRLSAARRGSSRLRVGHVAGGAGEDGDDGDDGDGGDGDDGAGEEEGESDDGRSGAGDSEFDFLAREMDEEG